jgi:hypothetical protein
MTCSKTISVSSKTVNIKEQSRYYYVGESVTGITPDPNIFEDSYETSYWSTEPKEPSEAEPVVWYYDKTVFTDNSV